MLTMQAISPGTVSDRSERDIPAQRGPMDNYVLGFQEIDQTQVARVGGKGAHLGELSRVDGIRVPAGFCVTTDAYRRIIAEAPSIDDDLDRLSRLNPDDGEAIRTLSANIRRTLEAIAIPDDLAAAITGSIARLGEQAGYAVRSSATAEDLPTASFAGQQDTYLNVVGSSAILHHVSRCWASLFTERAVTYRLQNGYRPPEGFHGRGRAADGLPELGRHPVHDRPRNVQPQGRGGGGQFRPRRVTGFGPGKPGHLHSAGRRNHHQTDRHQAGCHPCLAVRRDPGRCDRSGAAGYSRR